MLREFLKSEFVTTALDTGPIAARVSVAAFGALTAMGISQTATFSAVADWMNAAASGG